MTVTAKTVITHLQDYESNDPVHERKWKDLLDSLEEVRKLGKSIRYELGYCNFTFELWMALHKGNCAGPCIDRTKYLDPINRLYGERFENLDQYKHEQNFNRVLGRLSFQNVLDAIDRAECIMKEKLELGHSLIQYRRYTYYRENPSLSIHEVIREILSDCALP